ncbi:MAG: ParB N-terminal domain-containing protein [Rhodobacter sp.]|nr:ParB N-terminal domain-containing protein [Rhodobacter sp.]
MSKRRVFDIDFPGDGAAAGDSALPEQTETPRRGPMAAAINENARAVAEREEAQAAIRRENDALAREFVRLKKLGLIVDAVPIDRIVTTKLARDRAAKRDPELDELKTSIQAIGLSNPIRVEEAGDGYELVQGYRRLEAYRELFAETGDERFARIPAGLVAKGETIDSLYRRMVDENLIRRDVSFAEMAELARNFVDDAGTGTQTLDSAIRTLFASAGRQKRNYIARFANLLAQIGPHLSFPEALPRSVGLALEKRLSAEPGFAQFVVAQLRARPPKTTLEEVTLLRELGTGRPDKPKAAVAPRGQAKTTLKYNGPGGMVRCLASEGRFVVLAERDFSNLERTQLEAALDAFFRVLDESRS